jgi:4-hydroxybenzoate polyprenyltransferase
MWVWSEVIDYSVVNEIVGSALFGTVCGTVGGSAQWLVLRRWLPHTGWWVPVSMVGLSLGFVLAGAGEDMVDDALFGAASFAVASAVGNTVVLGVLGAVGGCAQWLVLRRRLPRTGWWIPASMVGGIASSVLVLVVEVELIRSNGMFGFLFVLVGIALGYGLITGLVMAWLLRGRKQP